MSLNIEKIKKKKEDSGSFWTSYSDLATMLSVLFLMLYVVAALRSTALSLSQKVSSKKAQEEIESLQEQLQSYEVLKEKYLNSGASEKERRMYQDLMDQMQLIESETRQEKDKLMAEARENEVKEQKLNRYQRIIRGIIDANMLAQKELRQRDQIISKKSRDLVNLQQEMQTREEKILKNKEQIAAIREKLNESIQNLRAEKISKEETQKSLQRRIRGLEEESEKKVAMLELENRMVEEELNEAREIVASKSVELEQTQKQIQELETEKSVVLAELESERRKYKESSETLKKEHQKNLEEEKRRFEEDLNKVKLTSQQRLKRQSEHKEKMEAEKKRYAAELKSLEKSLRTAKDTAALKEKELMEGIAKQNELARIHELEVEKRLAQERKEAQSALAHQKALKLDVQEQLQRERSYLEKAEKEKLQYHNKLSNLSAKLEGTQKQIGEKEVRYAFQLQAQEKEYKKAMDELKLAHAERLQKQKEQYEEGLNKERMGAEERLTRQKAFADQLSKEKHAYNEQMRALSEQLGKTRKAIGDRDAKYQQSLAKLSEAKGTLERELSGYKSRENERRAIAKKIRDNFARSGIKADIDPKTGEVTIQFGEEYFDTGSSDLKPGMTTILERAVPVYATSLLEDKKLAEKISSVEIVGFASPTYRGRYINPKDLGGNARKAVNYNMDLSYQRARAIFSYVFDTKKMQYQFQKDLLGLAKVTGQGYLKEKGISTQLSGQAFCEKFDCVKSQKVLIKFNFKDY